MGTSVDEVIALSYRSVRARLKLETLGAWIMRYGLVVVFLLIGFLKFTAAEAAGYSRWSYTVRSCLGCTRC